MYTVERYTAVYMKGLNEFMKCAEDHRERMGETRISCPCKECRNIVAFDDPNMIRRHLIEHGFDKNYTCWDLHGEAREPQVDTHTFVSDTNHEENDSNDDNHQDNLDEMLHDAEINVDEKNVKKLQQLFVEAEKALYNGCKKFTKISFVLRLLDLKAKNNWSDKSFTTLLELLHEAFPEDNELPVSTYKAKKLTCPMGLEVQRIHACRNDCILYRKNYKDLHECPVCKESRYKHKNLTELDSDVKKNGPPAKMLWYLPIIPRLKKLYANPKDAKLLRWHAEERLKQPGNDIDVYLRPLIDDMIDLWGKGFEIYDAYKKRGYGTKGEKACPVCEKNTHSQWLTNGRKIIYMGHHSLLGLLLNIPGKTKDGVNAQKDMVEMGIKNELAPQVTNGTKMYLPPACYTLSKAEKTSFCVCLHGVKVPSGYSANIKNLVSMKDLKLLEGSIVQGYVAKEVVQFCTNYMDDVADIGLPQPPHQGRLDGVGTIGRKDVMPTNDDFKQAHFTVLQNMTCIEPYIHEHMSYLVENNSRRDQRWLEAEHKRTFSQWLADKVIRMSPTNVDADVIHLGYRPRRVLQYQGYDINGYTFYTEQQDDKSTVQNSRVTLIATTTDSSRMTIVDNTRGVKVDSDGFTCVNLSTNGYLSNPFILAKQATQVFYVKDPKDKRWHIVLQSKRSIVGVDDVVDEHEYNKFDELPPFSIGVQSTDDDPPEPRTRRGINRIQDLSVGESIEFNQFGQAVGKWQYLYGKYLGTRTRRIISILKKNWKQVNKEEKNFLLSDIKKLRAQASERGKKHISRPRLGPKGYRGFKQQWQEERNDPDKATKLHLIPYIHGSNYCLARAPRDKNRIKTLPPELIDVSNNLVQATRELAQGSNESKAGVDPLILLKDIEEIRNEVRQQMKEELKSSDFWEEIRVELKAELRNEMQPEQNLFSPREDDVPNSVHMKSCLNSTTIMVRNETQAQQNESFSPRQEGNHSSVQMSSNLSSTKSIRRKEQQGEYNESISTRQVNVPSSVQRRSNITSTTSIIREEHQGEQNESISTRQVDVPSSVHRRSSLISTTSIIKLPCIKPGEKVACATATVYSIGDGTVHFKKLLKGHMKVLVIKVVEIHKRMSKAPISGVQTKRVMPQHENAPSTKKGKGNETPKEPNKQDKVEKEKAANRKSLQALEDEVLSNRP
ncbi:protein exportin 1A [Tanacetum coccineum]|uniref:Protein exportin 1A n=1 Tax=Tanacetum coccineum TaxID=301880 RepID=A0ABQ5H0G4_9ASTR